MKLLIFQIIFAATLVLCKPWTVSATDCSADPLVCAPTEKCVTDTCTARNDCDPIDDCKDHGSCETDYSCKCTGYTAIDCSKDVDECAASTSPCHKDANCANTDGSFTCTCKSGFTGDGKTCEVIPSTTADPDQKGGARASEANKLMTILILAILLMSSM